MRKFKTMKNNEDEFNKKFEEDLKEIKEKIHAEKLSDEFKANLQARLEEELNKDSDKKERKIHFPVVTKRLVAACACLIIFFSSCFTFADDIENVILEFFGNTDKIIENAIANGNYKKIDMEYVEDNGISIKVDYVVVEENQLYIAFNILSEEEFNKIYFDKIKIEDNNNSIFDENKQIGNFRITPNRISKNNIINIYKINSNNFNKEYNELSINVLNIFMEKNGVLQKLNGEWNFDIK